MKKIKTKKDLKGLHVSIPCPPLDILQNFTNTGSLSFSKYKSFCFKKKLTVCVCFVQHFSQCAFVSWTFVLCFVMNECPSASSSHQSGAPPTNQVQFFPFHQSGAPPTSQVQFFPPTNQVQFFPSHQSGALPTSQVQFFPSHQSGAVFPSHQSGAVFPTSPVRCSFSHQSSQVQFFPPVQSGAVFPSHQSSQVQFFPLTSQVQFFPSPVRCSFSLPPVQSGAVFPSHQSSQVQFFPSLVRCSFSLHQSGAVFPFTSQVQFFSPISPVRCSFSLPPVRCSLSLPPVRYSSHQSGAVYPSHQWGTPPTSQVQFFPPTSPVRFSFSLLPVRCSFSHPSHRSGVGFPFLPLVRCRFLPSLSNLNGNDFFFFFLTAKFWGLGMNNNVKKEKKKTNAKFWGQVGTDELIRSVKSWPSSAVSQKLWEETGKLVVAEGFSCLV